jgi:hypothetical protein
VKKSQKKTVKKSVKTKRSYRLGVKVSEGGKTFDARSWQEKAFDRYIGSARNMEDFGVRPSPNDRVTIEEGGHKYTVFFNRDANGISYHPAKIIQKIIEEEVPDEDRTVRIYKDNVKPSGQKPYKHEDDTEHSDQPWKCVKPYNKKTGTTDDRIASCKPEGLAKKGYAKKGGISRQSCIETCNYE